MLRSLLVIAVLLICNSSVDAQNTGEEFIYGLITTVGGEEYRGFIRWNDEEVTWSDTFNSTKYSKSHRDRQTWSWGKIDWKVANLWKDNYSGSGRLFSCQFGDIAVLHPKSRERVDIELKNGSIIQVQGGSNDIGTTLRFHDYEMGLIKLRWDRIERIELFQAPTEINPPYDSPIYGIATSIRGDRYEGYIKWDNDERIGEDVLDGDSRDGEKSIPFRSIAQIEKQRGRSRVSLRSGRELVMDGSNDVSNGNRGIHIYHHDIGEIELPWSEFDKLEITTPASALGYNDFPMPKPLSGQVLTFDGNTYEGQIVFDKDEMWDIEGLNGSDNEIDYTIPFRNIKRIIPKNRNYSLIELRVGEKILLGNGQDVSSSNDGIIVVNDQDQSGITIDWDDVDEIIFD
ncbi:MAG: hypothetical protein AAFQ02_12110 [Bacteroidota bacterium]